MPTGIEAVRDDTPGSIAFTGVVEPDDVDVRCSCVDVVIGIVNGFNAD